MEDKIANIRGKIDYADKIASEELIEPPEFEKEQEYNFAIQELDSIKNNKVISNKAELTKQFELLRKEELELTLDIDKIEKELQAGKKIYHNMIKQDGACCPTCKQILTEVSKLTATKEYKNNLITLFDKQSKLKERYKEKHFDIIATQGKIYSLENSNNTISPEVIKQLEENISVLEKEKQENIRLHNEYTVKLQSVQNAKSDIKKLEKEIKLLNKAIEETKKQCEIAKQLYFNSIKEKMSLADKYLNDVKIRFYKVIKATGEIKDDFVITYKDKDFSVLSKSEKTAASLEIANMFNKISKLDSPLFIDDSESYPDFDFLNMYKHSQILIAKVQKGRNLKITNKQEKITGFKSEKSYTKKTNTKTQKAFVA